MDQTRCSGCGAVLQTESAAAPGYLPTEASVRGDAICRRCFRIRHYGEFSRLTIGPAQYAQAVSQTLATTDVVLYVLDVFDLAGSILPELGALLQAQTVIAVVNKLDLLPQGIQPERLAAWVRRSLAATGVQVQSVRFVSAQRGTGVADLARAVDELGASSVSAVGAANVGKSSLLNRLLRLPADVVGDLRTPRDAETLTTSRVPGTTLGAIAVLWPRPGGAVLRLIDTPGLLNGDRCTDALCAACLKQAVPQSRLRPRVFQLDPGQTLFLGGFARLDFDAGRHQPLVVYVSNQLVVHRTKRERADEFSAHHMDDILQVPCASCRQALGPWQVVPLRSGRSNRSAGADVGASAATGVVELPTRGCDLVLAGLGWVSFFGTTFSGNLHIAPRIHTQIRDRLIGRGQPARSNRGGGMRGGN